ncbi:unnamed protein product [Fraxinus pennsylvanica]|uniref:Uncharacterized protein n=1 Tax=Fraxinus pennsylvanica TaxID=56036 RepID=A0AAD1YWL2_9LAMI|nr:unnamed protein product [Fraxinus pennsylvanica]
MVSHGLEFVAFLSYPFVRLAFGRLTFTKASSKRPLIKIWSNSGDGAPWWSYWSAGKLILCSVFRKLPGFSRPKVAAYPFHPISPLILNKSSGGTKGPLAAAATVISPSFKSNFILAFRSDAPVTKEEETSALEEAQSSEASSMGKREGKRKPGAET